MATPAQPEEPERRQPRGSAPPPAALAGDLAAISLFDIAQMLVLCGHTGVLTVWHDARRGDFYYRDGAIVQVVDDRGNEGMIAAVGVLLWEQGSFQFTAGEVQVRRVIEERGDAFLLEAAHQVDEFRASRDPAGEAAAGQELSEEASLMLKRRAMERLRDLFSRVTAESAPPRAGERGVLDLAVLGAEPARLGVEAVYLRPGQRVVARRGRRLVPLWSEPLGAEQLHRWLAEVAPAGVALLPAGAAADPAGAPPARCTVSAADGSLLEIAVFGEAAELACVVRIVLARIEEPAVVGLDPERLAPLLERPRGLVALAAPRGRARGRAFAALCSLAARRRGGLVVCIEKHRSCLLDQLNLGDGSLAVFQRRASRRPEIEAALDLARAEEAELVAADPLAPAVLDELEAAAWPLLVLGTVPARGALAGCAELRRLVGGKAGRGADAGWWREQVSGVVATGQVRVAGGYRPAAELLPVTDAVAAALAAGHLEAIAGAFAAGEVPGAVSLAQLAA